MKCKNCSLVEMLIMARNNKEVIYQCPKCLDIYRIDTEQEELISEKE